MRFHETRIPGVFELEIEPIADERGFFARTFCAREFEQHGLEPRLVQASFSFSPRRGTLRGMHFQAPPHGEAKLVRCIRGRIFDVALDLRRESPAFLRHVAVELSAERRNQLYIAPGVAHGFLTREPECEVVYQMSAFFESSAVRGVRYDDPAFAIPWPAPVEVIAERDRGYPDFTL